MTKYKNKAYSLRIDNELMEKIRKVAEIEDRPINKQIERICRDFIKKYEDENGIINIQNNVE